MYNAVQIRAKAELERRRRPALVAVSPFLAYRFDPIRYIIERLGWHPWAGTPGNPGQVEILEAYTLALRQQHERLAYERGELSASDLQYWQPGDTIQNRIRIEAGHGVGKTKLSSGILSHFFDTCTPSIAYTFAPTWTQIETLLWKEIKADRRKNKLPGRVLETCEIKTGDARHFAKGRATQNGDTESIQGQHNPYLMFILDEAEGMPEYVWSSIDSMTSGGISIVVMLGNPRTRTSRFHKIGERSTVANFRLSCLYHPNVLAGAEIIPGAVRRDYVLEMLEEHAQQVAAHDPDRYTFELPWLPGVIYEPDDEMLFRVLGIPALNTSDDTFVPVGRYEAAKRRVPDPEANAHAARVGVDVARYGSDAGTIYANHRSKVWRHAKLNQQDTTAYAGKIVELGKQLHAAGARSLHVRVDAGGGFGGGVVDQIKHNAELRQLYHQDYKVIEVDFGGSSSKPQSYADCATEMYATTGEALKALAVVNPPNELESDLTERAYKWVQLHGVAVKKLVDKEQFRKDKGRSPDDGDGFVLAVAPDYVFAGKVARVGR